MVTHERLREVLHYDPLTGLFTWKMQLGNRISVGSTAGSPIDGYIRIAIDGKVYRAHRLAWFYMTGVWPLALIDHKDTNRSNNVWENLREATRPQNNQNRAVHKNSLTGVKGVGFIESSGRYSANIKHNKIHYYLGTFATMSEATEAVRRQREKLHKDFSNHG